MRQRVGNSFKKATNSFGSFEQFEHTGYAEDSHHSDNAYVDGDLHDAELEFEKWKPVKLERITLCPSLRTSRAMPMTERKTITMSSWFHLSAKYPPKPSANILSDISITKTNVKNQFEYIKMSSMIFGWLQCSSDMARILRPMIEATISSK